jgi:hypothetical protein
VAGGGPATVRRGEGELDAPRTKNGDRSARATLTVVVLATAEAAGQRRSWRSDSDGRLWTGRQHGRDERGEAVGRAVSARALSGRRRRGRGELSGRVARCPDSGFKPRRRHGALSCGPGAARGV